MTRKLITAETLKKWGACHDGFKRFCELFPEGSDLKTSIDGLVSDNHSDWGFWLFSHARKDDDYNDQTVGGYRNSGDWNSGCQNSGNQNSGNQNSGNRNSGDWNSGNRNSGNRNSGNQNSGNQNSGNRNSGNRNSGDWNSGNRNSGNRNSGDWNSGNQNSGDWNSGNRNSGNRNSGNRNSGDWNSGDWNSGFFNSKTPNDIIAFNKTCDRDVFDAAYKPDFLYFDITYWVPESEMTDADKASDPSFYVRGGQLRKRDYKEAFKLSWDNADKKDRMRVKDLPNFDEEVFFEISGIRVSDYEGE